MLERDQKSKMEAPFYKADGIYAKELEDELMKFTVKNDYKVDTNLVEKTDKVQMIDANLVEKTDEVQTNGDVEVNIVECTKSLGNGLVAVEYDDTTENSSSFDDTNSGAENVDTLGDSETLSDIRGDATSALDFDGFERFRMRKKKLTTHWRSFIQPLMWRCKWVELQIKKLESQAQQYDRELKAYNKQKQTQLDESTLADGVKSLPFSGKNAKNDIFKRNKRRRAEATTDVAAYMSHHNLFSCYENKKYLTEGAFMNNEPKNPATPKTKIDDEIWGNDEIPSFELGDGDIYLERILRNIDFLQSLAGKLKSKVDQILSENAERISFADSLNWSPPSNENGMEGTNFASPSTSLPVPQTAVTSDGDFPVTNGSTSHACFGAYKNVEDGVPIDSQMVQEETNSFEEVKVQPIQRPLALNDGLGNTLPPVLAEPNQLADDQPPPTKIRSIAKLTAPKTSRRRGRKKAATGRRGRRSTG